MGETAGETEGRAQRPARVVLVRHGQTAWSADGRHTGWSDIPLTDQGREQAGLLASRLRDADFAAVVSSPLSRAAETARLAGLGNRLELDDDLREWDYGKYEGRRTAEVRAERPGWEIWRDGVIGGETIEQVGQRMDRALARLAEIDGMVAVFSHGHALRVLTARWLDLPPQEGRRFILDPATVCILGWDRERPVVARWNDDSHLRSG